ncbi:LOW QUALITY PROTEIN: hypothetical protein V1478_015948 [Vespula squamosa]|uniref:Leucine-rich PPR motif-containing protein, mitochondrial n=1 Tax=Vespula squamosa TaxID=30214 RepID=A0ABD2A2D9_VESSQ
MTIIMALFLWPIKYFRCLRNVSKRVHINDSHKNCLSLASNELALKERNQQIKESDIDGILKKINNKFKYTDLIDKHLLEDIIYFIEIQGKLDPSQALSTLQYCGLLIQCTEKQKINFTNTLWKLCNIYNVPMNVNFYNTLLQVYVENKYQFSPLEILSDMKRRSIEPDKLTYKKILEYYCKNGNMEAAMIMFKYIKDEYYPLDVDIYNLIITGYFEVSDPKNAINVLRIIQRLNLTPSVETYITLMCGFAKYNDIKNIQNMLLRCQKKNIYFTNKNILDVIYTLIAHKNVCYVDEMLEILKKPYQTEAIDFFGKVIDLKQEDIATKILFHIYPDIKSYFFKNKYEHFFINKFIYSDVNPQKVIDICTHFYTQCDNTQIFIEAIYVSFKHDNDLLTLMLLEEWKKRGHKLRPHYFWPLLTKVQNNRILKYIKDMITIYDVTPCAHTIANFIIPNLLSNNFTSVALLKELGIPEETARNAIVCSLLNKNKTKSAFIYVSDNPIEYIDSILGESLRQALFNTYDIHSYLGIARHLYTETRFGKKNKVPLSNKIIDIMDFLYENPTCISKIMEYLLKNKLQISNDIHKTLFDYQNKNLMHEKMEQSEKTQTLRSKGWSTAITRDVNIFIADKLLKKCMTKESKMILKKLINEYPTYVTFQLYYAQNLILVGNLNDAEIIEYTSKIIKCNGNILENYIEQSNIIKTLETAITFSEKYKHVPALKELIESIVLIEIELLQYFINVATKTKDQYILIELVLCFLKNEFEEEAKKIIKVNIFCTSNYKFTVIQNSIQNSFEKRHTTLTILIQTNLLYTNVLSKYMVSIMHITVYTTV